MNEQVPHQTDNTEATPISRFSRRKLIGAAAVVMGTVIGVREYQKTEEDYELSISLGNSDELRGIAENEGSEAIVEFFSINKMEYPTPSALSEKLGENFKEIIFSGCNPTDAADYTVETLADYQAEASGKYVIPAAMALGGNAIIEEAEARDGDITATSLYQKINAAHKEMLEHYMKNMTRDSEAPIIEMKITPHEAMPDPQDSRSMRYLMTVDFMYLLLGEKSGPLTIAGSFNMVLHNDADSEAYQITLDNNNPTDPFMFAQG